jgi:hypothetical protein
LTLSPPDPTGPDQHALLKEHLVTNTTLPERGVVFWPVGTGDSTTVVVDEEHVLQIDLRDFAAAEVPTILSPRWPTYRPLSQASDTTTRDATDAPIPLALQEVSTRWLPGREPPC